jgi:hypothetical protein
MRLLPNNKKTREFYPNFYLIFMLLVMLLILFASKGQAMDFKEYINTPVAKEQSKNELRIAWRNAFGWDVFQSYFVIKDIENKFKDKLTMKFYRFRGRPEFADDYHGIEYIFKYRF